MAKTAALTKHKSPVSKYPGSKRLHCDRLFSGRVPDAVVEPFAGAAHYSFFMMNQRQAPRAYFWAECEKSLQALYATWAHPEDHAALYDRLKYWQIRFKRGDLDAAWGELTSDYWALCSFTNLSGFHKAALGATGLVIRKLTFGAVMRSANGKCFNHPYVKSEVPRLISWKYKLPPCTATPSLYSDWSSAIKNFSRWADAQKLKPSAEILIDPPYYAPPKQGRRCSPAYLDHEPHADRTKALFVNSFQAAIKEPRLRRITVTGYFSDELNDALLVVAGKESVTCKIQSELKKMNNSGKPKPGFVEAIWTVKRGAIKDHG